MPVADLFKKLYTGAQTGLERGVNSLRGAAATPAATAATAGVDYAAYDRPTASLGTDGQVRQNRDPRAAPRAAAPAAPTVAEPANRSLAQRARSGAGNLVRGVGAAGYGAGAVANAIEGDAGNAIGDAALGASLFTPAGKILAPIDVGLRAATGGGIVDNIGRGVKAAYDAVTGPNNGLRPTFSANQAELASVATANPTGQLAQFQARTAGRGVTPTVPAQAPAQAPAAATAPQTGAIPSAAPAAPTTQRLTPQDVAGLRSGAIDPALFAPGTAGTGFVTTSDGRGVRFNAQAPAAAPAQPAQSTEEVALARLRDQASSPEKYGQRRAAEAAKTLLDFQTDNAKLSATNAAKAAAASATRAKDFEDKFVKNAFTTTTADKDGVPKTAPDEATNNAFLDFARENLPYFKDKTGFTDFFGKSDQEQQKIVSELRAAFIASQNVQNAANENATLFTDGPGRTNAGLRLANVRESNIGDIPQIGLGTYVNQVLNPFASDDVAEFDTPATQSAFLVPVDDYVGDPNQEGSLTRREQIARLRNAPVRTGR